jgi:hypothetical protein
VTSVLVDPKRVINRVQPMFSLSLEGHRGDNDGGGGVVGCGGGR